MYNVAHSSGLNYNIFSIVWITVGLLSIQDITYKHIWVWVQSLFVPRGFAQSAYQSMGSPASFRQENSATHPVTLKNIQTTMSHIVEITTNGKLYRKVTELWKWICIREREVPVACLVHLTSSIMPLCKCDFLRCCTETKLGKSGFFIANCFL